MHEVVGRGDGTVGAALDGDRARADLGLPQDVRAARRDDRRAAHGPLAAPSSRSAVTMYHLIVEATLAQPGQHFIEDYLSARDVLPGFREGMRNVALDEQRHIGFGVKLLHDLAAEDPEVPDAVAELLREVAPLHLARVRPAELGPPLHGVLRLHARGDLRGGRALVRDEAARRRAAARDAARARRCSRSTCRRASARSAGWRCCRPGILGEKNGPPRATPRRWRCCSTRSRRARRLPHRAGRAADRAVGLPRRRAVAPAPRQRLDRRGRRPRAASADITFKAATRTSSTSSAGAWTRGAPMATGRLRPRGSLRTLWSARGLLLTRRTQDRLST